MSAALGSGPLRPLSLPLVKAPRPTLGRARADKAASAVGNTSGTANGSQPRAFPTAPRGRAVQFVLPFRFQLAK